MVQKGRQLWEVKVKIRWKRMWGCGRGIDATRGGHLGFGTTNQIKDPNAETWHREQTSDEPTATSYRNLFTSLFNLFSHTSSIVVDIVLIRAAKSVYLKRKRIAPVTVQLCSLYHPKLPVPLGCHRHLSNRWWNNSPASFKHPIYNTLALRDNISVALSSFSAL